MARSHTARQLTMGALTALLLVGLVAPVGPGAHAEPVLLLTPGQQPPQDYTLAPDGRPWTTGDYERAPEGVSDQWALWPACASDGDALTSFDESGDETAITASSTTSRDDFCIESVTVAEGTGEPIALHPVLAGTRGDGTARYDWIADDVLDDEGRDPALDADHGRRVEVLVRLQSFDENDRPRLTLSVQGGPGCDTSGDDANLPPWDIGDCVLEDDGFSQMPTGVATTDPESYNDRKRNLAAGRTPEQSDARTAHVNLPPDNRYEVTLRIGPAGSQTPALDPFAATFTGADTSFEVTQTDGTRRLIAGGVGDARPGFPPAGGEDVPPDDDDWDLLGALAFTTAFTDLAADGRSPRPWTNAAGAEAAYLPRQQLQGFTVGWSCFWEQLAAPAGDRARSRFVERSQLNATFFLAEGFRIGPGNAPDLSHIPDQLRGLVVETDANDFRTDLVTADGRSSTRVGLPLPSWDPSTGELSLQVCNPHHAPLHVLTLARLIAFDPAHDGERAALWPDTVRPVTADGTIVTDLGWRDAAPTTGTAATHVGSPREAALDDAGIVDVVNVGYYRVRLTPAVRAVMGLGSAAQLAARAQVAISTDDEGLAQLDVDLDGPDVVIDARGFTYSAPTISVSRSLPATWALSPTAVPGDELVVVHAAEGLSRATLPTLRLSHGTEEVQTLTPASYAACTEVEGGRARITLTLSAAVGAGSYTIAPLDDTGTPVPDAEGTFTVAPGGSGGAATIATCPASSEQAPPSGGLGQVREVTPLPDETRRIEVDVAVGTSVDVDPRRPTLEQPVSLSLRAGAAGRVTVGQRPATGSVAGFALLGHAYDITAPAATPARPHELVFRIRAEVADGDLPLAVLRDGEVVRRCRADDGRADPDPCVREQTTSDGVVTLRVLTSTASTWTVGVLDLRGLGAVCATPQAAPFSDVTTGSAHAAAIGCLTSRGIISGRSAELFAPRGTLTRGQAATLIAGALETAGVVLPDAAPVFDDVPAGSVHAAAIGQLAELGIVRGRSATSFDPDGALTRAQLASLAVGALELALDRTLSVPEAPFEDVPASSPHARSIATLSSTGIVRGTGPGTYDPDSTVTREQAASILARLLNRLLAERSLT